MIDRLRLAYLATTYPALSQPFIEREVAALRALGVEVHTFTVRPAPADAAFLATSHDELQKTVRLLDRPALEYVGAHLRLMRTRPRVWWAGLRTALKSGASRPREKIWQLFYFTEAIVLFREMTRRGLRHVHVHHANNVADIARLVVAMGRVDEASGWRWTLSMHGPTEFADPIRFDLAPKVRDAAAVACISEYCRKELEALAGPEHRAKLSIVRMSAPSTTYSGMAAAREERSGSPVRVLFVGRLVPEKAPDALIRAIHEMVESGVEVVATVVGRGPLEAELTDLVASLRLEGRVNLVGPVGQDQLPAWYLWADIFCLPSLAEGVPVVLMEAMATELPVVSTAITGIPELVENEVSGLLVVPGSSTSVADALRRLAADAPLRSAMGRAGRRRVVAEYDATVNAQRLIDAIGDSTSGGADRPAKR